MRLGLIVLALVSGCAKPPAGGAPTAIAPAGDGATCAASPDVTSAGDACAGDADCVVTNFPGCCACPQCAIADPVARSRTAAAQAEAACAVASCDASVCGVAGMCPPGEPAADFTPRCCAGACVGVRATPDA